MFVFKQTDRQTDRHTDKQANWANGRALIDPFIEHQCIKKSSFCLSIVWKDVSSLAVSPTQ